MIEYLEAPARQAAVVRETAHRPWPLPDGEWVQAQTWADLLFLHWRVEAGALRELVPPQFPVDERDGSAWLGITPFRLDHFRVRGTLPLPRLSSFLELNVRTYVTVDDKPGIFFFSLECESPLAVEAARRLYSLPYHRARMSAERRGDRVEYTSVRSERAPRPFVFEASYRPTGTPAPAGHGSLEHFLTERYCLYTLDGRRRPARADIHHPPWPLQPAEAEVELNTMPPDGIRLPGDGPLAHYSRRQDVVIWPLRPL